MHVGSLLLLSRMATFRPVRLALRHVLLMSKETNARSYGIVQGTIQH